MKYLMPVFILSICSSVAMEQEVKTDLGEKLPSGVPSLRLLSFRAVEKNMHKIGWKTKGLEHVVKDIIQNEGFLSDDVFDQARRVDLFRLDDLLIPTAQKVAALMDTYQDPMLRKKHLLEFNTLSDLMRKEICKYRTN